MATMSTTESIAVQRAHGIELIGEFEGSGFKAPPLLARRADGQIDPAHAAALPGRRGVRRAARPRGGRRRRQRAVRPARQRRATSSSSSSEKLRPLGVLAQRRRQHARAAASARRCWRCATAGRCSPSAAPTRAARLSPGCTRRSSQCRVLLAIAAFDVWLFGIHGVAGGLRAALYSPGLLLARAALRRRRHRVPRARPRERVPLRRRAARRDGRRRLPRLARVLLRRHRRVPARPRRAPADRPRRRLLQRDLRAAGRRRATSRPARRRRCWPPRCST